jgi:hypothetical protein
MDNEIGVTGGAFAQAGGGNQSAGTTINIDARGAGAGAGDSIRAVIEEILRNQGREADALIRMAR